ncbi:DUF2249 domain-containing protein [Halobaculum gomorrense]|uniref:Uncharacterized conserved protein, DUF2249 family n=1 Tax=Halobaculum gomorrense TaxID=43928 RepID=A0A1M5JK24_9EURY|nr:DUF2249 domain-containing protein [Halobaculum gomorrense]SHG40599.1 Uncharacterized conserved protein, DUF2249 family [Halobaculum gomorrense]
MARVNADDADTGIDIDSDDASLLDVREVDDPPFDHITTALAELGPEETLVIVNSFEPEPLYGELERRGFAYRTTRVGDDEWRVAIEYG